MNNPIDTSASPALPHRRNDTESLLLLQLDPSEVADGVAVGDGYLAEDIVFNGEMRETCPACETSHLQMVLRQKNVKRAHMLCPQCTRCFDAYFPDGTSAFSMA